jgi:hypothetical protein
MTVRRFAAILIVICTPGCDGVAPTSGAISSVQIEGVTLLDHPSDRYLEVHGMVRNGGTAPLSVTVRSTVLDAGGGVVGSWRTPVPFVPAGGSARFQSYILVEGRKGSAVAAEAEVESVRPAG